MLISVLQGNLLSAIDNFASSFPRRATFPCTVAIHQFWLSPCPSRWSLQPAYVCIPVRSVTVGNSCFKVHCVFVHRLSCSAQHTTSQARLLEATEWTGLVLAIPYSDYRYGQSRKEATLPHHLCHLAVFRDCHFWQYPPSAGLWHVSLLS